MSSPARGRVDQTVLGTGKIVVDDLDNFIGQQRGPVFVSENKVV